MIAIKSINRDDGRDAVQLNILDLLDHVGRASLDIRQIGFQQFFGQGLTGNDAIVSAVGLEGASRDDENRRVGSQTAVTALDIEELLRADVSTETRLGKQIIATLDTDQIGEDAAVAVRDIGKRTSMDQRRCIFQCLQQVRPQRIFHQDSHRPGCTNLLGSDRFFVIRIANNCSTKSFTHILQRGRERQNCHDFAGNGDVKARLAYDSAFELAAQANDNTAQRPILDIQHAFPGNLVEVNIERVAAHQAIVDHGGQQIIGGAHRVNVASQMQVERFHRDNLGIAAACRAALNAKCRTLRRLA